MARFFKVFACLLLLCAPAVAQVGQGYTPPPLSASLNASTILPSGIYWRPAATRNPLIGDDTNAGYSAGNLWLGSLNVIWQANQVTAGHAEWAPVAVTSRSGDITTPLVAYGTKLLVTAYTGKALQLTRTSDSTTLDVGFLSGGALDAAAGDAFCAGTTCYMTTLYDQSGNAYNCTATTANAPLWSPTNLVSGSRAFVFPSNGNAITNLPAVQRFCNISASMTWNPSASTWFAAGQVLNSILGYSGGNGDVIFTKTDGSAGWMTSFALSALRLTTIGSHGNSGVVAEGQPSVFGVAITSSLNTGWASNKTATSVSNSQSSTTGAVLGGSASGQYAMMDLTAFMMWGSTLSAGNQTAIRASLMQEFGIPPQYDDAFVAIGDSMSSGEGSSQDNAWPKLTVPLLSRPVRYFNSSQFGNTLAAMVTNQAAVLGATYSASLRNYIVTLLAGANDIRASTPVGTIEANLQTYVSVTHALGSNAKILVATYPLQCDIFNSAPEKAELQALNTWILANWNIPQSQGGIGADGLMDFFADPTIGPGAYTSSGFCNNTAISPDGQHPTDLAMGYYAPIASAAINNIISAPTVAP